MMMRLTFPFICPSTLLHVFVFSVVYLALSWDLCVKLALLEICSNLLRNFNSSLCVPFFSLQILVRGFAYGGISEIDESDHYTCKMGRSFANEIGIYGHKPPILNELLAGKIISASLTLGYYSRSFDVDCSKADLETALQVISSSFLHRGSRQGSSHSRAAHTSACH